MSRAGMGMGGRLWAVTDWRSRAVLRRNALVYFRNWRTAFFPPAMEPVIFFLAFGLGLGGYVGVLQYEDQSVPYATWVAPGLLAYTAFGTPFFEGLYSAYVRMFYQKTWDGILATQVELPHIVWGEILWSGFRGMMNSTIVAAVLCGFHFAGLIDIYWGYLVFVPPIAFFSGCAFGAFGMMFTALVPAIDHMNYPVFLIGIPLGLISNTYFPVQSDTAWLHAIIQLNPVYHLAEMFRSLLLSSQLGPHAAWVFGLTVVYLALLSLVSQRLLTRRVLGS